MRRVTRVAAGARGRVVVELDGEPWRELPLQAAVQAGIAEGVELDREQLRALARARRQAEATAVATRALRHRDLSARELDARLARRGTAPATRRVVEARLERAGYLNDRRYAIRRAEELAHRHSGDALIRDDLRRRGLGEEVIEEALAAVPPEHERAAAVVATRGRGVATARFLTRRGFADDAVEEAAEIGAVDVASDAETELP